METWAKYEEALTFISRNGVKAVSSQKLYALPWETQCQIAYDPLTPKTVAEALKYSPDASVVAAAFQRDQVLTGKLKNPFFNPAKID